MTAIQNADDRVTPDWRLYPENYMGERQYRGKHYRRTYHPEFGRHVFQLEQSEFGWIEPFPTERECHAFIEGYLRGLAK